VTAIRYLGLLGPVAALLVAARLGRANGAGSRDRAGAALSFIAVAVGLAVLHEVATIAGWWSFADVRGAYRGFPVDLWLGWAVLWGPIPVLLRRFVPLPVALGLLLWFDVIAMPALDPMLRLGPHWLAGEAVGLIAVALPAQLLGRWTAERRKLIPRVLLQVGVFAVLLLWLVPTVAFTVGGQLVGGGFVGGDGDDGWAALLGLSGAAKFLVGQVAFLIAVPALAAVREFALRGGGTPFPWDPPVRLVTSGVYAYLANPMQVSAVLLLLFLALVTRSPALAAAGLSAAAFSATLAAASERQDLSQRYGRTWLAYRREVRDWSPRLRPAPSAVAGRLWLDDDCGPCAGVRDHLLRMRPAGLAVEPASGYPAGSLWRARYQADDGHTASGVAAVARGMEHGTVLSAYLGWVLLLPGLGRLAQLVSDALIAPPHEVVGKNGRR
jgi:protein-S-isoprenylcysteine O-methyltransferase Ste14